MKNLEELHPFEVRDQVIALLKNHLMVDAVFVVEQAFGPQTGYAPIATMFPKYRQESE